MKRSTFLNSVSPLDTLACTAPKTMHESSGEMSTAEHTPAISSSMITASSSRLYAECTRRSSTLSSSANPTPRPIANTLYTMGSATVAAMDPVALSDICAIAAHTLKASSDTASSSATTCSSVVTKWPFALYWRIVISVEAGAVADAIAPSSSEKDSGRWNAPRMTSTTSAPATSDSIAVSTKMRTPLRRSDDHLKYRPVPNAMNASAMSVMKPIERIISLSTNPRQYGPMKMPARI